MLKPSRKQLAVAVGLFILPAAARVNGEVRAPAAERQMGIGHAGENGTALQPVNDPRVDRLAKFFSSLHCPVRSLAADFVAAADENHIDWRLLPSISVVESGGGKVFKNNNIFGWNNGNVLFSSIRHSIHEIAYRLGRSPLYGHRDTVGKLKVYNSDAEYVQNVLGVMNRISPTADLASRTRQTAEND